ncbi:hypothetical protein ATG71_2088 [Bacillus sp. es.034]|nr:hypothetical protein ATG71_2088 [Bacillus sp. es.034]
MNKENTSVIGFLEVVYQVSGAVLLVCAIYYYFHFKKTRRERKLTPTELTVYVVTHIAFLLLGSSYLRLYPPLKCPDRLRSSKCISVDYF